MKTHLKTVSLCVAITLLLPACAVVKTTGKVAAFPVKAAYETTKFTGKTIYGTGKAVGKGVVATGKGIYYIGSVPVKITDKALDTTAKVLKITTQAVDLSGEVITVTRDIQATQLNAELQALRGLKGLLSIFVDEA